MRQTERAAEVDEAGRFDVDRAPGVAGRRVTRQDGTVAVVRAGVRRATP